LRGAREFARASIDPRSERLRKNLPLSRPPRLHSRSAKKEIVNGSNTMSKTWIELSETIRVLERCKDLMEDHSETLAVIVACVCRRVEDRSPHPIELGVFGDISQYPGNGLAY
jgi:hypothetical protein